MKIIPAIDVIDGKCVRLTQGDYAQKKTYNENPVEVARSFEAAGLKALHLVDLDGAKAGKVSNWATIKDIATNTRLSIDFGGGIKTKEEVEKLLALGVRQVNIGSLAVNQPELVIAWMNEFGSEKFILSADAKGDRVATDGWQQTSELSVIDFITTFADNGLQFVTCTDISTDGMLAGPNVNLYRKLVNAFPELNVIASGGVSSANDLMTLRNTGVYGAIVGKAIYEGKIALAQLTTF
ncbi:MAG: 1-(5-phosphoribosyl)-5-[(5-phosphoribosylamino)methylideneamino]imidazole-4-carboxamide isomerase [Bacteroidia bacterium]|nr:1-(5-phosphoribosyl)-5-[(5-phosphoribosylamino)methylideneamino]imidazole-4-carboxamide isomerase [Bacteroidia bacterium]